MAREKATLQLLHVAEGLHGDYEKAQVLSAVVETAKTAPLDGAVRAELLRLARQLKSDYERNRVLAALADPGRR